MSTASFDTMEAAEALTRAGLPEPQAKAIAITVRKAVSEGVATKSDVGALRAELKGDIGELRTELKSDIGALKAELKGDIGELRTELKGDIGELKGDIGELRGEVGAVKAELWAVKWVLGFMFAIVLAMAARLFGVV